MKRTAPLFLLLVLPLGLLYSQSIKPNAPDFHAKAVILLDYTTGEVLYEKEADTVVPPASLTKLVTLHVIYTLINQGELAEKKPVSIPEEAWARNMPKGSSLMFLGPGQNVSLEELMKGVAVSSGNDAARALAIIAAGSVPDFVRLMNNEVHSLGLPNLYFVEPAGLSEQNRITARDFAAFCRKYIELHPQSLRDLHSVETFTYPAPENLKEGISARSFTQRNRNSLLLELEYVDGLKTGYIDESGYNLAVTGKKNGMRLIGVVLGIEGVNHIEGGKKRNEDGRDLLSYGFEYFETIKPRDIQFPELRIWKGRESSFRIQPAVPVVLTILKTSRESLQIDMEFLPEIEAPLGKGDIVGELLVYIDGQMSKKFPLEAAENVERGNFIRVLYDSVVLFFRNL